MSTWRDQIRARLDATRAAGQWRTTRVFDARGQQGSLEGRSVVSFGGNDYLGLSHHSAVVDAAVGAARRWGTGATSARLLVGTRPVHAELENAIARWKGTESAVVYPTGFQANLGVLATLGGAGVTVFSDELNHASIIDGCRLARAATSVYRHGDLDHLAGLLGSHHGPAIVVTDTVFSMDGDVVALDELVALCGDHDALLVLDEAHAVLGPELDVTSAPCEVLRVGTLSKTLGALGGFVAASRDVTDLLVNRSRSFIFTTGLPPTDAAAALAAIGVLCSAEGDALVARLWANVDRLRPHHRSPIVPVLVGAEDAAMAMSAALLERGLFVPAVRPPTVAPGTSRLRIALSADHTETMLDHLEEALGDLGAL